MNTLLKEILPFDLTNGNEGRSKSWYKPAAVRKKFERNLILYGFRRKPFEKKVIVKVTRILGKGQRLWDSSSVLRGSYKELEDALVAVGWFHDDSPKFIENTFSYQDDSRRSEGPAIEIEVLEYEGRGS